MTGCLDNLLCYFILGMGLNSIAKVSVGTCGYTRGTGYAATCHSCCAAMHLLQLQYELHVQQSGVVMFTTLPGRARCKI